MMQATTLNPEASTVKPSSARDLLGEAARESTWLLGIALVALAYVLAVVVLGDDLARAVSHSFPPVGH